MAESMKDLIKIEKQKRQECQRAETRVRSIQQIEKLLTDISTNLSGAINKNETSGLLASLIVVVAQLKETLEEISSAIKQRESSDWRFEIERSSDGFIKNVIARGNNDGT